MSETNCDYKPVLTGMLFVKPRAYKNFVKNIKEGNNKALKLLIKKGSVTFKLATPSELEAKEVVGYQISN